MCYFVVSQSVILRILNDILGLKIDHGKTCNEKAQNKSSIEILRTYLYHVDRRNYTPSILATFKMNFATNIFSLVLLIYFLKSQLNKYSRLTREW